jgi:hypothetical protein
MAVNQQHLKQAWDVSLIATREDWFEWIHRLSVEFMKESPSHALRACMGLVDIHPPLAKELFNAAFLSCWSELYDQYQVRPSIIITHPGSQNEVGGPCPFCRTCYYVERCTTGAHTPSVEFSGIHGT